MPPQDFPPTRPHYVLLPTSETDSTQLQCDIGPGAARDSYNIEWDRINPTGGFTPITEGINENFSLTLPVDVNRNGTVYMCAVTIDHDDDTSRPYVGAEITLRTASKLVYAPFLILCMY